MIILSNLKKLYSITLLNQKLAGKAIFIRIKINN